MLTPSIVRAWVAILRDVAIVAVAAFMLVFETVYAPEPNPYVIGAGLTLLGIPPALRLDSAFRRNGDNGAKRNGG